MNARLPDGDRANGLFPFTCACQNLRRLTRLVTRIYDQELRKADIEITQFGLLTALGIVGEANQKTLSAGFAMDSTTLTRTLALLRRRATLGGGGASLTEDARAFGLEPDAGHAGPSHECGGRNVIFVTK